MGLTVRNDDTIRQLYPSQIVLVIAAILSQQCSITDLTQDGLKPLYQRDYL